ncbi:ATP-binding protein [Niveibacterium sp. 24ML]|uniref:ATP-binding protein n=1 Tax=Niveibacterium sp. 24ML TaxID=2985512 RepID=UPI00226D5C65|nr:ATP-binding protein [Niveibacterium sp. 24ML]MCX9155406.1 ATP-binding protein [Niveibacterium sp. 24ML]
MNTLRRWSQSLNLRLALILFLVLGGSYALMVWLLQTRVADVRATQGASIIASRVKEAEALLARQPDIALDTLQGLRIIEAEAPPRFERGSGRGRRGAVPGGETPPPDGGGLGPRGGPPADGAMDMPRWHQRTMHLAQFDQALAEALGRPAVMRPGALRGEGPGLWVRLAGEPPRWLWIPSSALPPPPPLRRFDPAIVIPVLGFVLAFAAALFLVVQVNRPLRKLGDALGAVGSSAAPQPLPLNGASEIRVLAGRFNDMLGRLAQMESDRSTMLAGIAHDLRTPLTRLQLQIELAAGAHGIDDKRKAAMLRELDQLGEIIDHFRLFAGGAASEPLETRELALLLEEMAEPWRAQGLELALQSGLRAAVKPAALRRALANLLDNAFAYGAAPVTLQLRSEAGCAMIEIRDHGPGIAPERIAEALRPFTRLDAARGGAGHSGLGLAIVERLIGEMGGRLVLENAAGGGLLARLVLNLAD